MEFRKFVNAYISSVSESAPAGFSDGGDAIIEMSRNADLDSRTGEIPSGDQGSEITAGDDEIHVEGVHGEERTPNLATDPAFSANTPETSDAVDADPSSVPETGPAPSAEPESPLITSPASPADPAFAERSEPSAEARESAPVDMPSSGDADPSKPEKSGNVDAPDLFLPSQSGDIRPPVVDAPSSSQTDPAEESQPVTEPGRPAVESPRTASVVLRSVPSEIYRNDSVFDFDGSETIQPPVPEHIAPVFNEMVEQAESEIPQEALSIDIREPGIELPPLPEIPPEVINPVHPADTASARAMEFSRR